MSSSFFWILTKIFFYWKSTKLILWKASLSFPLFHKANIMAETELNIDSLFDLEISHFYFQAFWYLNFQL